MEDRGEGFPNYQRLQLYDEEKLLDGDKKISNYLTLKDGSPNFEEGSSIFLNIDTRLVRCIKMLNISVKLLQKKACETDPNTEKIEEIEDDACKSIRCLSVHTIEELKEKI